jgi:spermidine synthase
MPMVALFTVTTFVAAALLFVLQPMVGKMILPRLGGGPSVWNTCMVFFQAALLVGYSYAHLVPGRVGIRRHTLVHPLLLLLAVPTFHLAIPAGEGALGQASPIPWLIWTLAIMAGPAFLLISTTSPLLQRWFASTGHPQAQNPYFLYAASNAGSFVGLLAYPLIIEPSMGLRSQSEAFSWGFAALGVLLTACAWVTRARISTAGLSGKTVRGAPGSASASAADKCDDPPITWARRGMWVLLSAIPSSLMLGVTHFLSTDVAAIPLMWVVPLGIYLLSFVLVFSSRPIVTIENASKLMPLVVGAIAAVTIMGTTRPIFVLFALHLLTLFIGCMLCHGRLAALRPPASRLTEFYLLMSLGGVLGGSFNGLVAPMLFSDLFEYPIALVLALAMRVPMDQQGSSRWMRWAGLAIVPLMIGYQGLISYLMLESVVQWSKPTAMILMAIVPVAVCLWVGWTRVIGPALAIGVVMAWPMMLTLVQAELVHQERSFFGVSRISLERERETHTLHHGTTVHGRQLRSPEKRGIPTTYYHRQGPLGAIMGVVQRRPEPVLVAFIGLGTGTTAAYGRPGDRFTYYEIDPAMVAIAENEAYFSFLADARARGVEIDINIGDGRLRLAEAAVGTYDAIIVDAFSSDAIPAHLLTVEALADARLKLKPGGLLAYHLSNRHLDLTAVVARIGPPLGLQVYLATDAFPEDARARMEQQLEIVQRQQLEKNLTAEQIEAEPTAKVLIDMDRQFSQDTNEWRNAATWSVLVPSWKDFELPESEHQRWKHIAPKPTAPLWTDDLTNILSVWR